MEQKKARKWIRLGHKLPNGTLNQEKVVPFTKTQLQKHIKRYKGLECYATYTRHDMKDFDNSCITAPLVFDLDDEKNPEASRLEAVKLFKMLMRDGLREHDVDIFFSGNKGFHIIIPYKVIGLKARRDIMTVYRRIGENAKKNLELETLDMRIFDKKRQLRLPNTKNQKTGLYKVPITFDELMKDMDSIRLLAKKPRMLPKRVYKLNRAIRKNILMLEKLELNRQRRQSERAPVSLDQVHMFPCIKHLLKNPPDTDRNNHVYTLALFFKSNNVSKEDAFAVLDGWTVLDEKEVKHAVDSAYSHTKHWGCNNNPMVEAVCDKFHCPIGFKKYTAADYTEPFNTVMEEAKNWALNPREKTKLTSGYKTLDEFMGGIMEDEVIIVTGMPGVGKTKWCFDMAYTNGMLGNKVLVCSMEMPNKMTAIRFIVDKTGISMQKIIQQNLSAEERIQIEKAVEQLSADSPFKFYKRGMSFTSDDIETMIRKIIEDEGRLDMVIIDHIRFIERDSKAKDHEEMERILKELTNIAQEFRVCIVCIAHFGKGDDTKPRQANDLLGGAAIRNYTTKIIQLWRKEMVEEMSESVSIAEKATQFLIQKNRYGGTLGTVRMLWDYKTGMYLDENIKKEDTPAHRRSKEFRPAK